MNLACASPLFHAPNGTSFADADVNGHRVTWPVRSKQFAHFLEWRYFQTTGGVARPQALSSAVNLVEAMARHEGPERKVHVRVAEDGGRIYLDLADELWRAVEIGSDGWHLIDVPPVRFVRPAGMLPLPVPTAGGSIDALADYINLGKSDDFVLAVSWLLAALHPRGPFPVLCVSGEQGSAKSFLFRVVRDLVDPNVSPIRSLPRNERDLFIAASNSHAMAFDNVSILPLWLSDALCRLATGAGFATRQLRTDQQEMLFDAARPVMVNGIEDFVSQPDLADRSIFLALTPIPDSRRRPEKELLSKFEEEKPRLLGALLDGLVHGLRGGSTVSLEPFPRMADFANRMAACETAFWPSGTFASAYSKNREEALEIQIEADSIATDVITFMKTRSDWTGTASELLRKFAQSGEEYLRIGKARLSTPQALSGRLRRSAPNLRKIGLEIIFCRAGHDGRRTITINKLP